MKKIVAVTGTRAEYGLLYWTLKEIQNQKDAILQLVVTGNHLSSGYGMTIDMIRKDGFSIDEEIDMLLDSSSKSAVPKGMGLELIQLSQTFDRLKPDLLLILGDRYETFIAATCAMMMNIPIAHMNGGESTEGAIDEQIRHAITKMAHLHFTGAEYYKERIVKMGEEPWRVYNVGQAGIENIRRLQLLNKLELEEDLQIRFQKKIFLITFHPATQEDCDIEQQINHLINAISKFDAHYIFTYPNADFGSSKIIGRISMFAKKNKNAFVYHSLGQIKYLSLMRIADVVVGNSSSGIIESPAFGIPTVNIGTRQRGRLKSENIIDTPCIEEQITRAIEKAMREEFKIRCLESKVLYDNGDTSKKVVDAIIRHIEDRNLMIKRLTF